MITEATHPERVVVALYRFVKLEDYQSIQRPLLSLCEAAGVKGTLLLAHEGINGTISGSRSAVDDVITWLRSDPRLKDLDWKESFHVIDPFHRMKVKLKKRS